MENVSWLGHASFFFTDKGTNTKIYYVDPYDLKTENLELADLIFITHAHQDHFSMEDIRKIFKQTTIVIAPPDILSLTELPKENMYEVKPNQVYSVNGFSFQTVPAYNVTPEKLNFHPQKNMWVGYIFTINGEKIYHAGDTDFIPEMEDFKKYNLDIALLPIGGKYTMGVEEAAMAASTIQAKVTIPMHYKMLLGDQAKSAEEQFKSLVTNSVVTILTEEK